MKRQKEDETMPSKRVRQIEHVEGNWPSFIYILVPSEANCDCVRNIIDDMNKRLGLGESNYIISLTEEKQGFNKYHISLSKLFFLRHFQIDSFVNTLRQSLNMKPFSISLSGSHLFTNEDKSRSFCSVLVQKGFNNVVQLIRKVDSILEKYKKDTYYSPPIPHCTIGSCVGDLSKEAIEQNIYGNEYIEVDDYDSDDENLIEVEVDCIHISIGYQDYTVPLLYFVCFDEKYLHQKIVERGFKFSQYS